jgi:tRNA-dihydrouridine synthase
MKPALLIVLLTSIFTGHYLVHAQTRLMKTSSPQILFVDSELEELDQKAHQAYNEPKKVPVLGKDAIKNYSEVQEAMRQQLVAECAPVDSEIVVRVELDPKGRITRHHMPEHVDQPNDRFTSVFELLSLKKAVIKGLDLIDLRFKF